ncbi:MAG TPA: hypothetical protein VJC03_01695 [bacterium]|nr:hypothetical protein [bacterium]
MKKAAVTVITISRKRSAERPFMKKNGRIAARFVVVDATRADATSLLPL